MDVDSEEHKLISPCRCSGSVKFIHEECLKTWIASHLEDIEKGSCELCKTPYLMQIIMKKQCSPKDSCNEGMSSCLFTPLLVTVLIILILISYLLISSYLPEASEGEEQSYTIALIVTCLVSSTVVAGLIINSCRNACLAVSIASWRILPQEFPDEAREQRNQGRLDDSNLPLDQQNLIEDEVLVVPPTVKIRGRRVPTPELRPHLTPLRSASSSIAFATPRTQSIQATPMRSRQPSICRVPIAYSKVRPDGMVKETLPK
jgi:hypothetical protein